MIRTGKAPDGHYHEMISLTHGEMTSYDLWDENRPEGRILKHCHMIGDGRTERNIDHDHLIVTGEAFDADNR
jgi:hypothetical protein